MVRIYHHRETTPHYTTDMHTHQEHELYFLLSGQRRYFIRHSIYDLSPGSLVLIPKGVLHKTVSHSKQGFDRFVLFFSDEDLAPLSEALGRDAYQQLLDCGCLQLPADALHGVYTQMEQMLQEFHTQPSLHQLYLSTQLTLLLLTTLRCGVPRPMCSESTAEKIQAVARYIDMNFRSPITLHDGARLACLEDTYFSKQFKHFTGFGFLEYLNQVRLREAQRLLQSTKLSVGEISDLCGFSGSNYFGDLFRRYVGMSPSNYRKMQ